MAAVWTARRKQHNSGHMMYTQLVGESQIIVSGWDQDEETGDMGEHCWFIKQDRAPQGRQTLHPCHACQLTEQANAPMQPLRHCEWQKWMDIPVGVRHDTPPPKMGEQDTPQWHTYPPNLSPEGPITMLDNRTQQIENGTTQCIEYGEFAYTQWSGSLALPLILRCPHHSRSTARTRFDPPPQRKRLKAHFVFKFRIHLETANLTMSAIFK